MKERTSREEKKSWDGQTAKCNGQRKSDQKLLVDFGRCRKKQLVEITTTKTTKGKMEKGNVILAFDLVRVIKNDQVDHHQQQQQQQQRERTK